MLMPTIINTAIIISVIIAVIILFFWLYPKVVRYGARLGFWSVRQVHEADYEVEDEEQHHLTREEVRKYERSLRK